MTDEATALVEVGLGVDATGLAEVAFVAAAGAAGALFFGLPGAATAAVAMARTKAEMVVVFMLIDCCCWLTWYGDDRRWKGGVYVPEDKVL